MTMTYGAWLSTGAAVGTSMAWNPVGWVILGIVIVAGLVYLSYNTNEKLLLGPEHSVM